VAAALDLPPLVALLLARRGIVDETSARAFLKPDMTAMHEPELLPGMDAAAARVAGAVKKGERIAVYGDYDVDGISGTALLTAMLRSVEADVVPYLPHRKEGYGFSEDAVRGLHSDGVNLIVTVDHGSRSVKEIALARSLGIDVVITDHHLVGDGEAPDAVALVNPKAPCADGEPYPFPWLCGTGVAFKLAWAVARCLSGGRQVTPPLRRQLTESLALVALATVADVVPLVEENRIAVVYGLALLRRSPQPGLRALLDVARIGDRDPDATDIAFRLAPRINAAGRLGDPGRALELLITGDRVRAEELAKEIDEENRARRVIEKGISDEAKTLVPLDDAGSPPAGIVLFADGWHLGVIGIVAARIAEHFHRPTVIIAMDGETGRGSARSVAGFHLERALAACGEHLEAHGGHAAAAGLEIRSENLEAFRSAFETYAEAHLPAEDRVPAIDVEARVEPGDLDIPLVRHVNALAPFGEGNPAPVFYADGLRIVGKPKTMGKTGDHLAFHVRGPHGPARRAVWFGAGGHLDTVTGAPDGAVAIAYRPSLNHFRGQTEVEVMIEDLKVGGDPLN
jgi:single-stranded-DNA-specific exonuclease